MDTNAFKKAFKDGWRPIMIDGKDEFRLKSRKVTWIPHLDRCIVRTDRGTLLLDKDDLELAKEYNLRRQLYAEEKSRN